jgi:hypothetical protein
MQERSLLQKPASTLATVTKNQKTPKAPDHPVGGLSFRKSPIAISDSVVRMEL